MAMVGLVEAEMEVVDGMHAGQSQGGWSHVGRCRGTSRVPGDTEMTPDRTAVHVLRSGYGRAGINTGRHKKAQVRCPLKSR